MATRKLFLVLALLAVLLGVYASACSAANVMDIENQKEDCANFASVASLHYRVVRQYHTDLKPIPVLFISVDPKDVTRNFLIVLGCYFGQKYSSEPALDLYILDNRHAAKAYVPGESVPGNSRETERSLRAHYVFWREKDVQWIEWRPDPNQPTKKIHIDLGKAPMASKR